MPSVETFLNHLRQSRLVRGEELDRLRQRYGDRPGDDALTCARALTREGVLTLYQANKLLNGRTQGFFLGPYRILRRLGEGGMGKVYLAVRERDGTRVAVKVLPPRRALEDEQTLKRFRREMELSRRVSHPNVAHTIEAGVEGDAHYMVVEFVPGDTLYHVVRGTHGGSGPLRVTDAARYFLKVVDGLEAAHEVGITHRDIKPSNLMVTPDGDAKLLDLGLARVSGGDDRPLTQANAVVGTLDYASPEQLGNAARADTRSDLYSLGCTLYFTLTGRPPFEGGDIVNKIFRHRMEEPEPVEKVALGVPKAFAAIVRKLMAKEPSERYQSCAEVRSDLSRWTDPARVRALQGAEVERARAFRPPPPALEEGDLRVADDSTPSATLAGLRELGSAEVTSAPMYRPSAPPRAAVIRGESPPAQPSAFGSDREADAWVWPFVLAAFVLGGIAILLITLFKG